MNNKVSGTMVGTCLLLAACTSGADTSSPGTSAAAQPTSSPANDLPSLFGGPAEIAPGTYRVDLLGPPLQITVPDGFTITSDTSIENLEKLRSCQLPRHQVRVSRFVRLHRQRRRGWWPDRGRPGCARRRPEELGDQWASADRVGRLHRSRARRLASPRPGPRHLRRRRTLALGRHPTVRCLRRGRPSCGHRDVESWTSTESAVSSLSARITSCPRRSRRNWMPWSTRCNSVETPEAVATARLDARRPSARLTQYGGATVGVETGTVSRPGAGGAGTSVYFRTRTAARWNASPTSDQRRGVGGSGGGWSWRRPRSPVNCGATSSGHDGVNQA